MKAITGQRRLTEQVYDALVDAICEGHLAPGERLTQDEVAERLDVSRLPVGQALRQLRLDGFLVEAGRRGLKVAPLDDELIRTVYEFRGGMDQLAAGLAARRADTAGIDEGRRLIEAGRAAVREGDVGAMIDADMAFHWLVYRLADNRMIIDTMQSRWHHVRRIMLAFLSRRGNRGAAWDDHQAILDAIAASDSAAAERLARRHCDRASGLLIGADAPHRGGNDSRWSS